MGFLGTDASTNSDLVLVLEILIVLGIAFAFIKAKSKNFVIHHTIMIPAVLVVFVLAFWMINKYDEVEEVIGSSVAFHAVLGTIFLLLVLFQAGTAWLDARKLKSIAIEPENIARHRKLGLMIILLWFFVVLSGIAVYYDAYV